MASTTCELSYLLPLHDLLIDHSQATLLFCDNQAPLHIAANLVFHERIKNTEIDCHFIRDKIQVCVISTLQQSTCRYSHQGS